MSTVKQFSRANVKMLAKSLQQVLDQFGADYGINVATGNSRFVDKNMTMKLQFSLLNEDGSAETEEMVALKAYYPQYVGKSVSIRGQSYEIVGYRTRATKNKFLIENHKGKRYTIRPALARTCK